MRATSDVRRSTYDDQRGGRRQGTYMKQSTESMRALFCSRVAFWGWAHMWTFWLRRMFTIRCVLGAPENAFSEIRLDCIVKKSRNGNARVVDFKVGQARSSRFAHSHSLGPNDDGLRSSPGTRGARGVQCVHGVHGVQGVTRQSITSQSITRQRITHQPITRHWAAP